jgi:hypothetical protein
VTSTVVMPALVAGIHVFIAEARTKTWMAGTSPAMTNGYAAFRVARNSSIRSSARRMFSVELA